MNTISKPILFSSDMVRALLDGRKTQTRRICKFPKWVEQGNRINKPMPISKCRYVERYENGWFFVCDDKGGGYKCDAPHPAGSLIWVKETWRQAYAKTGHSGGIIYRADQPKALGMDEYSDRHIWKPSIFMRKEYSRITLEVTAVKVERLNSISVEDCRAEGCNGSSNSMNSPYTEYAALWEKINSKGSWALNPFVWCYSFKVVKPDRSVV